MLNDQTFEAPAVAIPTQRANAAPMQRGTAFTQNRNGESNGAIVGFTAPQDRSIAALLPIMAVSKPTTTARLAPRLSAYWPDQTREMSEAAN